MPERWITVHPPIFVLGLSYSYFLFYFEGNYCPTLPLWFYYHLVFRVEQFFPFLLCFPGLPDINISSAPTFALLFLSFSSYNLPFCLFVLYSGNPLSTALTCHQDHSLSLSIRMPSLESSGWHPESFTTV